MFQSRAKYFTSLRRLLCVFYFREKQLKTHNNRRSEVKYLALVLTLPHAPHYKLPRSLTKLVLK